MVLKKEYDRDRYLDHGDYKPCQDITIGALIEYLEQFPKDWRISIHTPKQYGDRFVLIDADIETLLTEDGEGVGP